MKKTLLMVSIVSTLFMGTAIALSQIEFAPIFDENAEVDYTTDEINNVVIEQVNFTTYDMTIEFHDEDEPYDDVEMHISRMQGQTDTSTIITPTHSGQGIYHLEGFSIASRGDYYITVFYEENGERKETVLPITFPIMQPKIYINQGLNNIMFEIDPDTSWSSFIDPEGINLYRSNDYVFNDSATRIEENLPITEWQYLDSGSNEESPYYYIELNSKEGRVTFRTSALFSEVNQTAFNSRFITTFDGETMLEVTGNMHGPRAGDAERNIRLRVGDYPATTMLENQSTEDDSTRFRFLIDIQEVLQEGNNDMTVFYTENGTMLEAPLNALGQNIEALEKTIDGYTYTLSNPSDLNIQKRLDITTNDLIASFVENDSVFATFTGNAYVSDEDNVEGYELVVDGLDETFTSDVSDGFSFTVDLSLLPPSNAWRDIHLTILENGESHRIDLPADAVTTSSLEADGMTYQFPEWNNELKLYKE